MMDLSWVMEVREIVSKGNDNDNDDKEENPETAFSDFLRNSRLRKRLTQAQVCGLVYKKLGSDDEELSQATLSAWENGRQKPSTGREPILRALEEVLGIESQLLSNPASGSREDPKDQKVGEKLGRSGSGRSNLNKLNTLLHEGWRLIAIIPHTKYSHVYILGR